MALDKSACSYIYGMTYEVLACSAIENTRRDPSCRHEQKQRYRSLLYALLGYRITFTQRLLVRFGMRFAASYSVI